ncbi:hypothetical protein CDEST_01197 [Colletotrichum destructivum]|uniref:Uncharacterized protein n=1 Tax=Colletotrichum destructivum TaxID=34406 RepID=A0AAX4HZC1_9PEZI|nr:hypothetical protein CDEST_01197 [Colletotrichum destructivum]
MFAASFFRKWFDAVPHAGAKLPKVMKSSPERELPSSPVKSILPGAEGVCRCSYRVWSNQH